MKKCLTRVLLASALVFTTALASKADLLFTTDPAVIAELESGVYPNCQGSVPSRISGDASWVCVPSTKMGGTLCCQIK